MARNEPAAVSETDWNAVLSDAIVKKMDALLRGDSEVTFDPDRTDWDRLFSEWYHKKAPPSASMSRGAPAA